MTPPDPSTVSTLGTILCAVALVQLLARRRLDLGGATVSVAAIGILLVGAAIGPWMATAALLAGLAWWRGARHGVGRPDLVGGVLAVAVFAIFAPVWFVGVVEDATPTRLVHGSVALVALSGFVSALLAAERRGLVGQRIYHWREVPVQTGPLPEENEA